MKQIIQDIKSGETILEEIPAPQIRRGYVLIKTHRSLISLGTERMLVEFGKANLLDKARQQPDKVKMVLEKVKSDGLLPTIDSVLKKLDEPMPLGYCNAGEVIEVGEDVSEFKVGDRVASNGNHAEIVCIPKNLVAKIPDNVSYDEASFTVLGAIGLQGIRLVQPTFGETVVVIGLGLVGLITCQLLIANGCRVVGVDFDTAKIDIAKSLGVNAFNIKENDPVKITSQLTGGQGVDAVVITAATKSNEVISQSAQMSRKKGRIVLVGVVGLNIKRAEFFEKELSFQVSCSYGPGRYDEVYEINGNDYPFAYVRWTEKRNFEAVLNAISAQKILVKPLISEIIDLKDYNNVYGKLGATKSIGTLLRYNTSQASLATKVQVTSRSFHGKEAVLGIIGSGNFTKMVVVPTLKKLKADIKYIASAGGVSSTFLSRKYNIGNSTTNYNEVINDDEVKAVLITTRHDLHARMCIEALKANKHVFVEKPLALNNVELGSLITAHSNNEKTITVGYNRRFSPFSKKAKALLGDSNTPINVVATMNAGFIPSDSWIQNMKIGGGRIIGEACHFVDLITYLTGSLVESVYMTSMGINAPANTDNATLSLNYRNGSLGIINYFANGNKSYSKERIEIYSQGRTIVIDNFRSLKAYGFRSGGLKKSQDKGHVSQFTQFVECLQQGGKPLIPFEEIINTSKTSFAAIESLKLGQRVEIKS